MSVSATKAFDEFSVVVEANDKMNTALERCEEVLSEILDELDIDAISVDILGMPLIDAQNKKWKGLFASIAQLVFDNAVTHNLIKNMHIQVDTVLREKYGKQDENETSE